LPCALGQCTGSDSLSPTASVSPSRSVAKPVRFFIDTNVFVYTFDETSPVERAKARELVELALTTGLGVVSHQVIQEFFSVATRKFDVPLSAADARAYLEQVLAPLWRVSPTADLYVQALAIQETSGYGFYDSLIVASAIGAGCNVLYSQDLQHGRRFGAPTVVDPFV
jgi:predicted nucleic acid-binding protein